MKILLVEDNTEKAAQVVQGIDEEFRGTGIKIELARDATSAKRLLREEYYDLMLLDLALPLRADGAADNSGGVNLLGEVLARAVYKRPGHVIGLTALSDIYESVASAFAPEIWTVVYFDASSDLWLERVANKIRHIAAVETARSAEAERQVDVAIVVAVPDELAQVRANGWNWTRFDVAGDATIYYRATYPSAGAGRERKTAVLARTPLMGMSAASILATKMGFHFAPRVIVMAGICAGDSEQVQLGDVIVANPAWDYGSGKHKGDEKGNEFEPAPYQLPLSTRIRGLVERLSEEGDVLRLIRESYNGERPRSEITVHVGPLASGAAVVANKALFAEIQKAQHRKLMGIDMEAYGVMSAAAELLAAQPECLVIKGVSDFADVDKGDKVRHYAAFVSAKCVTHLCEQLDL